jgi:DNA-3-methyladenine glycosylase
MNFSDLNSVGRNSFRHIKLPPGFYRRNTVTVAKELLGKIIFRKLGSNVLSGMIVETEAYMGKGDPASHSHRGVTKRNETMFRKGGIAYVYFTYGNHYCFNVVTENDGVGSAVLIRAVEPLKGVEVMMKNRGTGEVLNLTSGPGKFTKAFGIDKDLNRADLSKGVIYISSSPDARSFKIVKAKRIGITRNTEKLYRFYIAANPFVSR